MARPDTDGIPDADPNAGSRSSGGGGGKYVIRYSRKGPVFVTTNKGDAPVFTLADGRTIVGERADKYGGLFANGGESDTGGKVQYQWVIPGLPPGAQFKVNHAGQSSGVLSITGQQEVRSDGGGLSGLKAAPNKAAGQIGGGYNAGGSNFGGGYGGGQALPTFTDASSLAFQPVSVPQIPIPNYQPIDPQVYTQQVGAQNRSEYLTNLGLSQAAALGFTNTEAKGIASFAPQQEALQQSLVSNENQFNQGQVANANRFNPGQISTANSFNRGELDSSINSSGLPIRDVITEGLSRARQLAKGFLPTSIEDRAFEQAARAKAGDNAVASGLGTSSFTQNAIDKYTIGERLNLAQYGSNEVDKYLTQGVKLLVDSPIKYNPLLSSPQSAKISQGLNSNPSFSVGGAQQAEQGNINQLTSLTPGASLSLYDQQRQYRAQLENNINQFNVSTSLGAQQFNSTGNFNQQLTQLSNDQTNASKAFNFAQTTANYVNQQYQQQLAQYAQSQGYSSAPYVPTVIQADGSRASSGVAPTSSLGQNPSTAYRG